MTEAQKADNPEEAKPQKSYHTILRQSMEEGLKELKRNTRGLWLSSFSAGLDIGFSVLLMTVMLTIFRDVFPAPVVRFLMANMYPIGFIFVVMGRSELFTEHTSLAVLPVLARLASIKKLLGLWGVIFSANIAGAFCFALALSFLAGPLKVLEPWALGEIGRKMIGHSWGVIFFSAIMAGWLMGLMAWLVASSKDTISQVFYVWLIATAIGLSELHHCVVGTVEVMAAVFSKQDVSMMDYLFFISGATLGNIIGGGVFVAILKYSHIMQGKNEKGGELEMKEKE